MKVLKWLMIEFCPFRFFIRFYLAFSCQDSVEPVKFNKKNQKSIGFHSSMDIVKDLEAVEFVC